MILNEILFFFDEISYDFDKFENHDFWKILVTKLENLECKICSKIMKFNYFLMNFIAISIFWWQIFEKLSSFLKNHDFDVSQFCGQVVKFVWRVWCHLVNLTIVTHSQISPSERSHSSDTISCKNDIKIRHIDPQNVETKSGPKI